MKKTVILALSLLFAIGFNSCILLKSSPKKAKQEKVQKKPSTNNNRPRTSTTR